MSWLLPNVELKLLRMPIHHSAYAHNEQSHGHSHGPDVPGVDAHEAGGILVIGNGAEARPIWALMYS